MSSIESDKTFEKIHTVFKKTTIFSLFMFKFHNDQLPKNLSDIFSANYQIHSYGTRHADDCHIPHKSTTLGQYSLAFQGPKIWNGIDSETRNIKSFNIFKNIIKRSLIDKDSSSDMISLL